MLEQASSVEERERVATDPDIAIGRPEERGERAVIGRLIRRLRISDSPKDFQTVATTVLRTSLELAAVAWIPKDPHESAVISGSVAGLSASAYRAFPSPAGRESRLVYSFDGNGSQQSPSAAVRRYASVAAGSLGWLLAINPLDDRPFTEADLERLQYVASLIAAQLSNARIYADLKELLFGVIRGLTAAIDAKDPYTSGHSERVARIAARLGEELGMSPAAAQRPLSRGPLARRRQNRHRRRGPQENRPLDTRRISQDSVACRNRRDDSQGLEKAQPHPPRRQAPPREPGWDRIPRPSLPATISRSKLESWRLPTAFDAMSSNRPYRKRLSFAQIDKILLDGRGIQWDPDVIDALFACRSDIEAIRQKGLGESLIGAVNVTLGRN